MTDPVDAAAPAKSVRSDESLKSLTKVSRVLDCFTTSRRSLSPAEICTKTGYPRSTTHRLLAAMREVGFIEQDRERDFYRLGLRLF
ncbi:helix-turn-helix domain-containing protein (plasmid) [Devosia sp. A8/3-2]|nr:helix-turn-helix domain-containing protein [Devosia sp. A8/3-2]